MIKQDLLNKAKREPVKRSRTGVASVKRVKRNVRFMDNINQCENSPLSLDAARVNSFDTIELSQLSNIPSNIQNNKVFKSWKRLQF